VAPVDFNSYGARRGNDRVMTRGTFANIRLHNLLAPGTEGGVTRHLPDGETMPIYDAAMKYRQEGVPLVILAGTEYGAGSSRDWAAKGTRLLGVRAVIASSFERIHRSNLVGMGILPLQFEPGVTARGLGLTGAEIFEIAGVEGNGLQPGGRVQVRVWCGGGAAPVGGRGPVGDARPGGEPDLVFPAIVRLDASVDLEYYRHGGILPRVLRTMWQAQDQSQEQAQISDDS